MENPFSSNLKLGFVGRTYVKPTTNSVLLVHWMCCNNMITSWLLNFVLIHIRQSIVYIKTAQANWKDLKICYDQTNMPKLFKLRKEIAHLTQGTLSVAAYFTKFRSVHDELECISAKSKYSCITCTCTIKTKLDTYDQTVQLTQFLMRLNEQFTIIRGQIQIMTS